MTERYSDEQIRRHWEVQAATHGLSPSASWSDHRVIEMEIAELIRRLPDAGRVLDVGCANGYTSARCALAKPVRLLGVDYVPDMIRAARERTAGLPADVRERLEFAVGDVMSLSQDANSFDAVVCVRVIINLGSADRQRRGLRECARVLKPGGRLLLSEATVQGWTRLNALRREWGLPDIPMPPFNAYLDEAEVVEALGPALELEEISNFASSYYVGTRVLKPLLAKAAGAGVDVADPNSEWNRWCSFLPASGDYGTQKLFVFRKRS